MALTSSPNFNLDHHFITVNDTNWSPQLTPYNVSLKLTTSRSFLALCISNPNSSLSASTEARVLEGSNDGGSVAPLLSDNGGGGGNGEFNGGGGGGDGGGGDDDEENEFGPILKFEEVMRETEKFGATLPNDILEAAKTTGIRKLLLLRYLELQGLIGLLGFLMRHCSMLRNRMLADPAFLFKIGTEIVIDSCCATLAEVQKRGKDFWAEFELYLADLLVGVVVNVALVGMLAPYARIGRQSVSSGFLGGINNACRNLPSSVFEAERPGCKFSVQQRIATLFYKGNAQRPEVRVVTWTNDELATDALPVHGFEHYKAKDYSLSHTPFSGSSYANGRWVTGDEPLYYVVSPKDIVIAKPRDVEDHINWLLEHGYYDKALAEVEATQGRKELFEEVGSRYLDHLLTEKKYREAASICPKVLRGSASAWERWIIRFAQLRHLPVLVAFMPTENPKLSDTLYELALVALAMNPSYHKDFLSAVKTWPQSIYSVLPVLSEIEPQLRASMMTDSLKEALAELYIRTGQIGKAFSFYADLQKPEVFDFIEKNNLHEAIREKVVQLMMLDSKRATSLLIQQRDLITPSDVVSQLLKAGDKCDFRYFLYLFLHSLFEVNPHAGKDFHDMQVELYADYDPKMLFPFLRSSQHYTLEKAYEICASKGLLKEQAFILGRMGNSKQALAVIINELGDMEEAVEFASMQNDDEIWEELIKQSTQRPEMVGMLLEHTVGNLDPLHIVNVVPDGLEIPRLRDRLVKIITDYRTETSLRHGCNDILKADIVNLLVKYYKEARHAVYFSNEEDESRAKRDDSRKAEPSARALSLKNMGMKSKTRAGGRCCMCFDPITIHNVTVVAFFCCHAYHMTCYMDASNSYSDEKGTPQDFGVEYDEYNDEVEEESNENQSDASKMRCILCTNASR